MIVKQNYFTTAGEMKVQLKKKFLEIKVSERTVHRELKNLGLCPFAPGGFLFWHKKQKRIDCLGHMNIWIIIGKK